MKELIFSYLGSRCHAEIVEALSVPQELKNFVGSLDGYEIYKTYGSLFNQFGFEAIKTKEANA